MNKKLGFAVLGAMAMVASPSALAKTGAPHTVGASTNFSEVSLSWQAPHSPKVLKWHNDRDYNGDNPSVSDLQAPMSFYAGSLFTADDLKANIGDKIKSVSFFQYRPVVAATVVVFKNGEPVARAKADQSKYEKNTWQEVALDNEVAIEAGAEYRVAVYWEAGQNMDFVAIKDDSKAGTGRGDQFSLDGKTWTSTGDGSYLVTANLANDVDEEPTGYDVYRNADKVASVTETAVTLADQPDGNHTYTIHALYAAGSHPSYSLPVNVRSLANSLPGVTFGTPTVSDLDVAFDWLAPLKGGNELTWSDKTMALNIGGTASSNTKVWIKNEYAPSDLIGFVGGRISAVNTYFAEDCVTAVTAWVMCDGAFVTYKAATADEMALLGANKWFTVALDEPVTIEPGHTYSYGVYVLHTPKMHPIAVGSSATVNVKGNSFSTSSPNSTNFAKSKPSYKTLASGGMSGNWMMTATIDGAPAPLGDVTYDLYRDGDLLKSGLTGTSYAETVDDLGTYTYSVVTRDASGRLSDAADLDVTVKLPAAYAAPVLDQAEWDADTRTVSLGWTTDKELAKFDEATYMVGFDEEMTMHWGAQFTAAELAGFKGFSINKLRFILGAAVKDLKIGVYTSKGVALAEETIPDGAIEPLSMYTLRLTNPVAITGDEDLVLAYSGTLAGGTSPIILDAGPLKTNGARVSLTGGATWMNLGTINATYDDYNIVIGALASETAPAGAPERVIELGTQTGDLMAATSAVLLPGVEPGAFVADSHRAPAAHAPTAKVATFNVYRNGKVILNTAEKTFSEKLDKFNVFNYYVTAVYENGWESPASAVATVNNRIDQRAVAPYGLTGTFNHSSSEFELSWQSPEKAIALSYAQGDEIQGIGLTKTGSAPIPSYVANRFTVEDLADHVGKKLDHIQFQLADNNVNEARVFVIIGENIVYMQDVPVSTLAIGLNDVRLNEPFEIPAGCEVGFGYYVSYANGVKPLAMASNAAVVNYSDLISSSAGSGYWYSLKTKYKFDRTFWVKGILAAGDEYINPYAETSDASAVTYNVYCDGQPVATGLTTTTYNAGSREGKYHVTAVDATGNESGASNKVELSLANGVDDIIVDDVNANSPVEYFNLQGQKVSAPAAGTTVLRRQGSIVTKIVVK